MHEDDSPELKLPTAADPEAASDNVERIRQLLELAAFTPRQKEVAELLMKNKPCSEIGRTLGISRIRVYQIKTAMGRKLQGAFRAARFQIRFRERLRTIG